LKKDRGFKQAHKRLGELWGRINIIIQKWESSGFGKNFVASGIPLGSSEVLDYQVLKQAIFPFKFIYRRIGYLST
jgi:hypothetical protein